MGLFGLLATLFSTGVYTVDSIKSANYTVSNREKARQEGKITYGDGKGRDYLTSTGEQVHVYGGKVYSLKNSGQVLYDMNKAYFMEQNKQALEEAKAEGKKYIQSYYHPNPKADRGYSAYKTELSTLKPVNIFYDAIPQKGCQEYKWIYYKDYLNGSGEHVSLISINEKEFTELGGLKPSYITPEQYFYQKIKAREKEMKKLMRRI